VSCCRMYSLNSSEWDSSAILDDDIFELKYGYSDRRLSVVDRAPIVAVGEALKFDVQVFYRKKQISLIKHIKKLF
jgi:hypothetical protein